MNVKFYYSVIVVLDSLNEDKVGEINLKSFDEFGCEGIEEYNLDEAAIDKILGREAYLGAEIPNELIQKLEGKAGKVKYHFTDEENASRFKAFLEDIGLSCELTKNAWDDWNKKWKEHYKSIVVSPELKIIPVLDEKDFEKEKDCIYIYPGMGFGTGTHETTYLCLKIATDLFKKGFRPANCFDFGCGSGILGVAVLKLTSANAIFCDVDVQALDNCKKNIYLNFDDSRLHDSSIIIRERLKSPEKFDLVFANILQNILLEENDLIIGSLKTGGKLIVSGLLKDQEEDFFTKFDPTNRLEKIRTETSGDWCAILFEAIS